MIVRTLDHVGIAVRSIEATTATYEALGLRVGFRIEVPAEKVAVAFVRLGEGQLELLEPLPANDSLHRFLEKRGEGLHHLAYAVPNLHAAMEELTRQGKEALSGYPKIGAQGHPVAFYPPKQFQGILTELVERKG